MKKAIATSKAPTAIGPYSQAIQVGNFLYVSGQLPIEPTTGNFAGSTIEVQTAQSLQNIESILKEAGYDMNDIIKTTVFLKDMEDFAEMNTVYANLFTAPFPARAAVQVARLPKDALVEIEAIAYKEA